MAAKKDPRTVLEAKRERILEQITQDNKRAHGVINRMGFGYGSRAYSRIKHMSNRVGDRLKERLDEVEGQLVQLGWHDPSKPVPVVRSEEEIMRDYCCIMNLDYEEEMAKRKALRAAKTAQ